MLKVVEALGGIQAQVHSAAQLQCAVRLRGMKPDALDEALWGKRTLIKTWAMRGTLHHISAADLPTWTAALRTRNYWMKPSWLKQWNKMFGITLEDLQEAIPAIAEALQEGPLTRVEIADRVKRRMNNDAVDARLRSGWGELLKLVAIHGDLCFAPNEGRNVRFVRPDLWLEGWKQEDPDRAIEEVCRRYLSSHGPATREEFARWWGFFPQDARRVLERLDEEVIQVDRDGDKPFILQRDLLDLQRAEENREVRVVGMFDAYTLAGLPHNEIVPKAKKDHVYRTGAWVSQVVLRGGTIVGVWSHERKKDRLHVQVNLFSSRAAPRKAIRERLENLAPYLGGLEKVTFGTV